ncbi:ABC transporter permease [Actinoalloteichus hymeniacidonis]|uniref:Transport permease protein n=1 Tax=Actinoalloteichus hymeniacidonis TaxID=340345 RepID=A0AAC9HSX6_9PSEU|nr:ABC transporter permease [Actinoalloteichus hymeniacidonis]AOS63890.1 ABC-type multidrug transport system, permease component [Actinoalloteichus hymeniacidonis]MBB5908054.1 ABC-2 type transport system permease protein [Actinoalloteichus hymeniacidonis]
MLKILRDTALVFSHHVRPALRSPIALTSGLAQPILYVALFGPLLSGQILSGTGAESPWLWFIPGVLVMLILFGTAFAGADIQFERETGALERIMATPVSHSALLFGRALRQVATLLVQTVLMICIVLPFGLRVSPLGVLVGLVLIALVGAAVGATSLAVGLLMTDIGSFYTVLGTVTLPLMLTSGVLLPMDSAPGWLLTLSQVNPLSYVVAAERALFVGDFGDPAVLIGLLVAIGGTALAAVFGVAVLRRNAR